MIFRYWSKTNLGTIHGSLLYAPPQSPTSPSHTLVSTPLSLCSISPVHTVAHSQNLLHHGCLIPPPAPPASLTVARLRVDGSYMRPDKVEGTETDEKRDGGELEELSLSLSLSGSLYIGLPISGGLPQLLLCLSLR